MPVRHKAWKAGPVLFWLRGGLEVRREAKACAVCGRRSVAGYPVRIRWAAGREAWDDFLCARCEFRLIVLREAAEIEILEDPRAPVAPL